MSHKERMKRYRANLRAGVRIVPVPMTNDDIGVFMDLKWVPEDDIENPKKIGEAVKRALGFVDKRHPEFC